MRLFIAFFAATLGASAQITSIFQFPGSSFSNPASTLVEVSQGTFMGSYNEGLFTITSAGTLSGVTSFKNSPFSAGAAGSVVAGSDGSFYGIRLATQGNAQAFRISGSGASLTPISSKLGVAGPLMEASDGYLWGTTGTATSGFSIFKLNLAGTLTMVASGPNSQTDGPLLQASDGNFYGATIFLSSAGAGQIYRVTPTGQFSVLHTFSQSEGSVGGLIQASNGLLYGTELYYSAVCPGEVGGVFSLSLTGQFKTLYTITQCSPSGIADGPYAGLLQASDGNLYATTVGEGTHDFGNVFRLNLDGSSISAVGSFSFSNGAGPHTFGPALTQGSDGILYGTAGSGGAAQAGVVFKLDLGLVPPLPSISLFQPRSGAVGTQIRIKGDHLIGLSGVSFNGIPAQFTAVNVNYAYATVPVGALSGPITVTTMNGSRSSLGSFSVQ